MIDFIILYCFLFGIFFIIGWYYAKSVIESKPKPTSKPKDKLFDNPICKQCPKTSNFESCKYCYVQRRDLTMCDICQNPNPEECKNCIAKQIGSDVK